MNGLARRQRTVLPSITRKWSVFRGLPPRLAEEIAVFLLPVVIDSPACLQRLLLVYPIQHLGFVVHVRPEWVEENFLAKLLQRYKKFKFDVILQGYERSCKVYVQLVQNLSRIPQVEALGMNRLILLESLSSVAVELEHSRNKFHMLCIMLNKGGITEKVQDEAAKAVARIIQNDSALLALECSRSGLKMNGTVLDESRLLDAVLVTRSLCYLRLREVSMDTEGAIALSKVLRTQQTIMLLDLGENPLGDAGVIAIAGSLHTNQTVKALHLPAVGMSATGGMALVEMAKANPILDTLFVKDDDLGAECGRGFASVLVRNTNLRRLVCDYCGFDREGCKAFIKAVRKNRVLKVLCLNYNGITHEDKAALIQAARVAGTLKLLEVEDRNEIEPVRCQQQAGVVGNYVPNNIVWDYARYRAEKLGHNCCRSTKCLH